MTNTTNEPGMWVKYVTGPKGVFGHAAANGTMNTVKQNFSGDWANHKGKVFGRVAGTTVGLAMAAHALKGIDSNGEERSGLVRLGEGVLGLGIAAGSLAGRRL